MESSPDMISLLRQAMRERHMTATKLSEKAFIGYCRLTRCLRGEFTFSVEDAIKISQALELRPIDAARIFLGARNVNEWR